MRGKQIGNFLQSKSTGTLENIGEYIEQSAGGGVGPAVFAVGGGVAPKWGRQSLVPGLHNSGKTMLKYISKQHLSKIYHVVQEL